MDINCPDQIRQWMEFPFDFINPEYKAGLDFSMESLKLANQCLGDLKAGMKDWPKDNFQQMLNMVVLGWGAYIGETVRRSYPAWTWDFPDPSTGELPQLVHEGLGGVGRMVWPAVKMALARLHEDELDVALCTRIQMEEVAQAITRYENNRELWEKELEEPT
nr:hypothetical protein [uncultured Oscillibacter sp.]